MNLQQGSCFLLTIKKKLSALLFGLVLAIGIAGCGSSEDNAEEDKNKDANNGEKQEENTDKKDNETEGDQKVAAVVNGEEIPMSRVIEQVDAQKQRAKQSGQELKEKDISHMKSQILTQIINTELLVQQAEKEEIQVKDEKVQEQYNSYSEKYSEEEFKKLLKENNLTEDKLKEQITTQLKIDKYIQANTEEVTVSDEEVKAKYDELKKQSDKLPEFEKVKPQLEQRLQQTKKREQIDKLIDKLREDSEIEKKINA